MLLYIANDTIFKASPAQSSTLAPTEKVSVKAGETYDITAIEACPGSHVKFTLVTPLAGRTEWYGFDKHMVAKHVSPQITGGIKPGSMRLNSIATGIIENFEGLELEHYICAAGVATIGLGTTRWWDGGEIPEGATVTKEEAYKLFQRDSQEFLDAINELITVTLTGKQIAALTSWIYNCGIGALEESTLRKVINAGGTTSEVQAQFMRWTNGGLEGLVRRREAEGVLWEGGTPERN
jgi:lysozyme